MADAEGPSSSPSMNKFQASMDKRVTNAEKRRAAFLAFIEAGRTVSEALKEVKVAKSTYAMWRHEFPDWKAKVDVARQKGTYDKHYSVHDSTFVAFRKRFFGMDSYWHHLRMVEAIEQAKPMEVVSILVPPEFGKTTCLEDYICMLLARDPNLRIAYVSEAIGHARKVLARIQRRMTDTSLFPDYIAKYGPFYQEGQERQGKPWTADYFTLAAAHHDERDYSFEARGAKSSIQGSRVDYLFMDDIQSRKSLNLTEELLARMRQEWLTRPGKTGRSFIVGNRVDVGDIHEAMQENDIIDRLVALPATDAEGKSLCPEMWPDEALQKRRHQVGEAVWLRTYQQRPKQAGTVTFTEEILEGIKDHARVIESPEPGTPLIMGLDPALGGGNSLTICAYGSTRMEVIDQQTDYGFGRTEEILERVEEFAARYRPQDFVIEMMAFQKAIGMDDRMDTLSRRYGFRIHPHTTGDNKLDDIFGVGSMAGDMRAQLLSIPWKDERARERMQPLLQELEMWRPNVNGRFSGKKLRQDRVMSLWFCWLWWQRRKAVVDQLNMPSGRKGLPWKAYKVLVTR